VMLSEEVELNPLLVQEAIWFGAILGYLSSDQRKQMELLCTDEWGDCCRFSGVFWDVLIRHMLIQHGIKFISHLIEHARQIDSTLTINNVFNPTRSNVTVLSMVFNLDIYNRIVIDSDRHRETDALGKQIIEAFGCVRIVDLYRELGRLRVLFNRRLGLPIEVTERIQEFVKIWEYLDLEQLCGHTMIQFTPLHDCVHGYFPQCANTLVTKFPHLMHVKDTTGDTPHGKLRDNNHYDLSGGTSRKILNQMNDSFDKAQKQLEAPSEVGRRAPKRQRMC